MTARILVVEDDPVSRDLLVSLLGARGHAVESADDSFCALRLIQEQTYDLVFIDYHLPEMDGYALARIMRTLGEKSGATLNMVAITADKFGLAARRGADAVFDRIIAKPIEPEALFAFTDTFLKAIGDRADATTTTPGAIDTFVGRQTSPDALRTGHILWSLRGLSGCPKAAVFPAPSASERASLDHCFRLVDPEDADVWILVKRSGLSEIETLRETATAYLKPVLCIDETGLPVADCWFKVGDGDSWTDTAQTLARFTARAEDLSPEARKAGDFDKRLLSYLYVSQHPIVLRRAGDGQITLTGSGGFRTAAIVPALKRMGSAGLVFAAPDPSRPDELIVKVTAAGAASIGRPPIAAAC